MGLKTEEELDMWFANEKERLSDEFMNKIDKDKNNIPKHRAKFDAAMKKLLEKYSSEGNKIVEAANSQAKKKKETT
ncbi:hypothetical protein JW756_00790 [Candidatus Woesearchaeota archaeon]|nr:hypothetical protein [Candidatus Woesearchaeota archaeon]